VPIYLWLGVLLVPDVPLFVVPGADVLPPFGCVREGDDVPDCVPFSGIIPGGHGAALVVPLFCAVVF
jgi:hypothetical protein